MTALSPFDAARFRHPWRPYQSRVLDALDRHLSDRQLHVIAPPGSGKTVLGLEALRRIGRPALVLTPTLTIREQWIERLEQDFECPGGLPSISRDALEPAWLTFLTYQGLYQLFRSQRADALTAALKAVGVGVIAADEAHHLRSEWWRCLDQLRSSLGDAHTLCLTATPPYDAPQAEWRRYSAFAGEVDEEIGVPELVREGSLCPHQDLLLLFPPDPDAEAELRAFEARMASLPAQLSLDGALLDVLTAHSRVQHPGEDLPALTRDAQFWLSVAVLLGNTRWETARPLLDALDLGSLRLPEFDLRWAEIFLRGWLVERRLELPAGVTERWRAHLSRTGALRDRQLALLRHPREARLLVSHQAMMGKVMEIVEAEAAHFGETLRMVVLTDHVRARALEQTEGETRTLGVVPIFQQLRRRQLPGVRPAVLTGSLVLLPEAQWPQVRDDLHLRTGHEAGSARSSPGAPGWVQLEIPASLRAQVVASVTALFESGGINLLCGTSALLGEGWDAPATNSLILASPVSTHVSSNQLRGRALRRHRNHPDKCSNLWHLCGVQRLEDDASPPALRAAPPAMAARFQSFVGLHLATPALESGLARMGSCFATMRQAEIDAWNRRMFVCASEVHLLGARWRQAIGEDRLGRSRQLRELRVPARAFGAAAQWRAGSRLLQWLEPGLARWAGVPGVATLLNYLFRRRLRAMARAVAHAMSAAGRLGAEARPDVLQSDDVYRLRLPGVDPVDEQRFLQSVSELFDPLSDPRYLLRHRDTLLCVPAAFGQRREDAERFLAAWTQHAGPSTLVYTRSTEGRLALLRAKEALLLHVPDWTLEQRAVWVPQA